VTDDSAGEGEGDKQQSVSKHYYVSTYCLHELHSDCRMFCKTVALLPAPATIVALSTSAYAPVDPLQDL
jgi:hypothetical protein